MKKKINQETSGEVYDRNSRHYNNNKDSVGTSAFNHSQSWWLGRFQNIYIIRSHVLVVELSKSEPAMKSRGLRAR